MLILARSEWPLWGKAMDLLGTAQPAIDKHLFLDEFGISIFVDYLPGRCA